MTAIASSASTETKSKGGWISEVGDNLGRLFRYVLPGILLLGAARVAYPKWFEDAAFNSWPHLAVWAAVALVLGNVSYAINRYVVDQAFDFLFWFRKVPGPAAKDDSKCRDYPKELAAYVVRSYANPVYPEKGREHVHLRASMAFLMLTGGECLIAMSVLHQDDWTPSLCILTCGLGLVLCLATMLQSWIIRHIDAAFVEHRSHPEGLDARASSKGIDPHSISHRSAGGE